MIFIKVKLKKSDDQTNIYKYRVAANISKSIFRRLIILKFMTIRQFFHVKHVCKNVKNQHVQNGRVLAFRSQL